MLPRAGTVQENSNQFSLLVSNSLSMLVKLRGREIKKSDQRKKTSKQTVISHKLHRWVTAHHLMPGVQEKTRHATTIFFFCLMLVLLLDCVGIHAENVQLLPSTSVNGHYNRLRVRRILTKSEDKQCKQQVLC